MKIFLVGFMGCGKTYWGKQLSQKLKLPFFDLDEMIIEREGKDINTIFAELGEEYFRLLEKEILHIVTESHESFVMATGGGAPCFFNNIDYIKSRGIAVWINCSIETIHARLIEGKDKRPLVRSIPENELKSFIIKKYSDRKIFYQQAQVVLSEDDITLEALIEKTFHN